MIPVIDTDRLRLRGFTWSDFPAFSAMWADETTAEFIPFAPVAPEDLWPRFNINLYSWVTKGFGNWAIVDASGRFVGTIGFFTKSAGYGPDYDGAIQCGWVFSARAHGKGYATEASIAAHTWIDAQDFGGRTVCGMDPTHRASIRVAEKTGYRVMRQARDAYGATQLMERIA